MYTVQQRGEQLFYAQLGRQGCSKEGRSCSRYRRGDSAVLSTEAENQLCSVQSTKEGGKAFLLSTEVGGPELF